MPFRALSPVPKSCTPIKRPPLGPRYCPPLTSAAVVVLCLRSSWAWLSSWIACARWARKSPIRFLSLRRRRFIRQRSKQEIIPSKRSIRSWASNCLAWLLQRSKPLNSASPRSWQCPPSRVSPTAQRECTIARRSGIFSLFGMRGTSYPGCALYLAS